MTGEASYLDALNDVLTYGVDLPDRTGTGRRSLFNVNMNFDIAGGTLPLVTTKKTWFKGILVELLWFVQGRTDIDFLHQHNVHIWDEWVKDDGTFGPVYGKQMRDCDGVDQLANVIDSLKNNPKSRRHIISLWNPKDLPEMALPPCHGLVIQFFTDGINLECLMYQRSADMFLGVPFNIASYALLTKMVAQVAGLTASRLHICLGDAHIYHNHFDQVKEQLERRPLGFPSVEINPTIDNIDDFQFTDFALCNYGHHPKISAPVAV